MLERTTKLYYESHVTIDPVFGERRAVAIDVAAHHDFRMARLYMRKSMDDLGTVHQDDAFMTGHSVNLSDITSRTTLLVNALKAEEFHVRRYKIEETVCDSRIIDGLDLFTD